MIFTLEALQAAHGDALLLHYGPADSAKLAVIDAGPRGIYQSERQAAARGDPRQARARRDADPRLRPRQPHRRRPHPRNHRPDQGARRGCGRARRPSVPDRESLAQRVRRRGRRRRGPGDRTCGGHGRAGGGSRRAGRDVPREHARARERGSGRPAPAGRRAPELRRQRRTEAAPRPCGARHGRRAEGDHRRPTEGPARGTADRVGQVRQEEGRDSRGPCRGDRGLPRRVRAQSLQHRRARRARRKANPPDRRCARRLRARGAEGGRCPRRDAPPRRAESAASRQQPGRGGGLLPEGHRRPLRDLRQRQVRQPGPRDARDDRCRPRHGRVHDPPHQSRRRRWVARAARRVRRQGPAAGGKFKVAYRGEPDPIRIELGDPLGF